MRTQLSGSTGWANKSSRDQKANTVKTNLLAEGKTMGEEDNRMWPVDDRPEQTDIEICMLNNQKCSGTPCVRTAAATKEGCTQFRIIEGEQSLKENHSSVKNWAIRQTLETEIASKQKSVDRFVASNAMDAAAHASAERDGLVWALFVLRIQHGV